MRTLHTTLLFTAVFAACVMPFNTALADDDDSYIAVVTGNNVYVRSGAADSYYPFGRVNTGDLVKVTGEKFNWGRIATTGPTFTTERFFGYIIYPTTQPGRFRLGSDGKTGTTLGRTDVLAPNLNTNFNPNDSWKPLIRLAADTEVTVLATTTTANNTVHRVKLPQNAEAWISTAYLRPATEREREAWQPEKPHEEAAKDEVQPIAESKPDDSATPEAESQREDQSQPRHEPKRTDDAPAPTEQEDVPVERETEIEPEVVEDVTEPKTEHPQQVETPETADQPAEADDETVMPALGNVPGTNERTSAPQEETPEGVQHADPSESDEPSPTLAERLDEASIDDLEHAFELLRKEDIETAEVQPLREMFLRFAERIEHENRGSAAFARARADQLELWADVQRRSQELRQIRERARIAEQRTEAARLAVDAGGDYVAVGRLTASTIYDGKRLPKMLRLQDPGTGRTVAYIEPDDSHELTGMLDQLIGVIGEKSYDGSLRLNVLQPRRIDILAPR